MASIIRVKRSTGANAPSTINFGELAVTMSNGDHDNGGARLFVGNNDSPDSNCLLYTSPSPRDKRQSRMPSSA